MTNEPLKKWLLIGLVVLALIMTGIGGLEDAFGVRVWRMSPEHAWSDSHLLMMLAILVALVL